ncbi:hypothetical protein Golomagni_04979 [Golovinomyces magnicellulatus]|nr:hypothetical protein Golomagni_04979 [Golovinomyces magnicellulatus]
MAPQIYTYHCICTSLLIASTHQLSSLPRRSPDTGSIDAAIILPLPSLPASTGQIRVLPAEGYTLLLGIQRDSRICTIRRSDGFEKRILCYCNKCNVIVGYELPREQKTSQNEMNLRNDDTDNQSSGPIQEKVIYLLPGGLMTTEYMISKKIVTEENIRIDKETSGVLISTNNPSQTSRRLVIS